MKTMALLIRREFWEHRAFVIAPAIVAILILATALMGSRYLKYAIKAMEEHGQGHALSEALIGGLISFVAFPFGVVMGIVAVFYLLDSLFADRKDRSVLFWKSLPLSDVRVVLSKFLTGAVVLPLLTFGAVLVISPIVALIASVRLSEALDHDIWALLWEPGVWLHDQGLMLYVFVVSTLWYLPIAAWFLLASAWASRAVLLWAALPPILVMMLEEGIFRVNPFFNWVSERLVGWIPAAFDQGLVRHRVTEMEHPDGDTIIWPQDLHLSEFIDPAGYLSSTGLWVGLAMAALLLWATIIVRRRRSEV